MAWTNWKSPTANEEKTSSPSGPWALPVNAQADNASWATGATSSTKPTSTQRYHNYGFSIPEQSLVTAVEYRFDVTSDVATRNLITYLAVQSAVYLDSTASIISTTVVGTPPAPAVYLDESFPLTGETITPAQVNSTDFGLWVYGNNGAGANIYLQHVQMRVQYEPTQDLQSGPELSSPSAGHIGRNEISFVVLESLPRTAITADDLQSGTQLSTPSLGQTHDLTADDIQSGSELSSPAVSEGLPTTGTGDVQAQDAAVSGAATRHITGDYYHKTDTAPQWLAKQLHVNPIFRDGTGGFFTFAHSGGTIARFGEDEDAYLEALKPVSPDWANWSCTVSSGNSSWGLESLVIGKTYAIVIDTDGADVCRLTITTAQGSEGIYDVTPGTTFTVTWKCTDVGASFGLAGSVAGTTTTVRAFNVYELADSTAAGTATRVIKPTGKRIFYEQWQPPIGSKQLLPNYNWVNGFQDWDDISTGGAYAEYQQADGLPDYNHVAVFDLTAGNPASEGRIRLTVPIATTPGKVYIVRVFGDHADRKPFLTLGTTQGGDEYFDGDTPIGDSYAQISLVATSSELHIEIYVEQGDPYARIYQPQVLELGQSQIAGTAVRRVKQEFNEGGELVSVLGMTQVLTDRAIKSIASWSDHSAAPSRIFVLTDFGGAPPPHGGLFFDPMGEPSPYMAARRSYIQTIPGKQYRLRINAEHNDVVEKMYALLMPYEQGQSPQWVSHTLELGGLTEITFTAYFEFLDILISTTTTNTDSVVWEVSLWEYNESVIDGTAFSAVTGSGDLQSQGVAISGTAVRVIAQLCSEGGPLSPLLGATQILDDPNLVTIGSWGDDSSAPATTVKLLAQDDCSGGIHFQPNGDPTPYMSVRETVTQASMTIGKCYRLQFRAVHTDNVNRMQVEVFPYNEGGSPTVAETTLYLGPDKDTIVSYTFKATNDNLDLLLINTSTNTDSYLYEATMWELGESVIEGESTRVIKGSGDLAADDATVDSSGIITNIAYGNLHPDDATVTGSGVHIVKNDTWRSYGSQEPLGAKQIAPDPTFADNFSDNWVDISTGGAAAYYAFNPPLYLLAGSGARARLIAPMATVPGKTYVYRAHKFGVMDLKLGTAIGGSDIYDGSPADEELVFFVATGIELHVELTRLATGTTYLLAFNMWELEHESVIDGTASRVITGTADLFADDCNISGAGDIATKVYADGDLETGPAVISGTGTAAHVIYGSGQMEVCTQIEVPTNLCVFGETVAELEADIQTLVSSGIEVSVEDDAIIVEVGGDIVVDCE